MRIAVFGTGGVGGYFGGRLAQAGEEVIFIARGRHLQAMQTHGLQVDSLKGNFVVQPVQATADPAEVGPVDAVLVATKAWQVSEAAQAMRPLVGPDTFVVPLQNGVEAPVRLAAVLGQERVLGGFCQIISFIAGPGHIRQVGADPYLAFGELDNRSSKRARRLSQAFERTMGVTAEVPPDIQAAMWGKFLLISSWSGLGAVTRAPVGVWRSLTGTRQMVQQAMVEVVAVAQARQIGLTQANVEKAMSYVDSLPAHATASLQRDIMAGRPSELDSQCGAVVRLGQEVGVETPTHAFLYHTLLPLELKARGEVKFPEIED
jgi:2-dehydropantoate 2-reductase